MTGLGSLNDIEIRLAEVAPYHGARQGESYCHRVSAISDAGESALTQAMTVAMVPPPPPSDRTWLIIAGAIGAVAALGVVWILLSRRR